MPWDSDRSCLPSGMTHGYDEAHNGGDSCTSKSLESVQLEVIHASILAPIGEAQVRELK